MNPLSFPKRRSFSDLTPEEQYDMVQRAKGRLEFVWAPIVSKSDVASLDRDALRTIFTYSRALEGKLTPQQFDAMSDDALRALASAALDGEAAETAQVKADEIVKKAAELVGGERERQHGAKKDNFTRIAAVWNAWLGIRKNPDAPLTAHDVGMMMVLMKAARTQSGAFNLDDYIDMAGYAGCAGEVASDFSVD